MVTSSEQVGLATKLFRVRPGARIDYGPEAAIPSVELRPDVGRINLDFPPPLGRYLVDRPLKVRSGCIRFSESPLEREGSAARKHRLRQTAGVFHPTVPLDDRDPGPIREALRSAKTVR